MSVIISPQDRAYQLAHPEQTSTRGLEAYHIVGICVIEIAVALRLWGKRLQRLEMKLDDYLLIICAILATGYAATGIIDLHHGYGHHTLTISAHDFEVRAPNGYANNLIYTTTFPISRISLVLLYKRVFRPKEWFKYPCWILIAAYTGYSISTVFVDAFGILPVRAAFDKTVPVKHTIDWSKLVLGNCIFNIITDSALLVLPLTIIWTLHMSKWSRLGLSFVFSLGVLTLVAACMRCYYSLSYDLADPDYSTGTGAFWTVTEVYLGILCPCLVTLHPVMVKSYDFVTSRLSSQNRERISKLTGVSPGDHSKTELKANAYMEMNSAPHRRGASEASHSLRSKPSDLEAQNGFSKGDVFMDKRPLPVDKSGMAIEQDTALTTLDPRLQAKVASEGQMQPLGSSAQAGVHRGQRDVPDHGIGIQRDWHLSSTREN